MATAWRWPGARWWRCDLHVHSPSSHDFAESDAEASAWVDAAVATGVEVLALTDHNSAAFIDAVSSEPRIAAAELAVIPGVELTTAEGVHMLALVPGAANADAVKALLGACGIRAQDWGKEEARATRSYLDCLALAEEHGALCIAPHADAIPTEHNSCKASLLVGIGDSANLGRVLISPHLMAAEIVTTDTNRHELLRGIRRGRRAPGLSLVRFSDAHALEEIGRRSTWIKMTSPSQEGLRLAFTDGDRSVCEHVDGADPNTPVALALESITVSDARVVGRSKPLELAFNPWFNALIGGRGTGKSTLVEMLRIALDRGDDLPPTIAAKFEGFARVYRSRDERGALTEATRIVVVFRKEGVRFRATWKPEEAPSLEEEGESGWEPAEGTVKQRLPLQIYSQNEIHEVAQDPRALLGIVDASDEVDRRAWADAHSSELARFLALRAQVRQLRTGLEREPELRGELADVNRKLAVFESAEHRVVLEEYQRRHRQARTVDRWAQKIDSLGTGLREAAGELEIEPLGDEGFDSQHEADRSLLDAAAVARAAISGERARVLEVAQAVEDAVSEFARQREQTAWAAAATAAQRAYEALVAELHAANVGDPQEFGTLVARREELEERLAAFDETKTELAEREAEAAGSLARLAELRTKLSEGRREFLASVLADNRLVQVELESLGDRDAAAETLRDLLGLEGAFEDDLEKLLAALFAAEAGVEASLPQIKHALRAAAEGDGDALEPRDRRFLGRLERLAPEALDRLDAWFPEDRLQAKFSGKDGNFKPLDQGSAGEKNAAILAFLLSYGDQPIVIDQPENDLDNRLISGLVVESLLACKRHRQLVIVTHNPNIVVNGDAEFVASLDLPAGEVLVECSGGLQERVMREEICEVLEGGREAFELRYSRIGRQSSA